MIKASKFAIAIAAVASLAIATTKVSSAAPIAAGAITVKAPATTEVVYRGYFSDDYGPYAYRPAYGLSRELQLLAGLQVAKTLKPPVHMLGHMPPPKAHRSHVEGHHELARDAPAEIPERLNRHVVAEDEVDREFFLICALADSLIQVDFAFQASRRIWVPWS